MRVPLFRFVWALALSSALVSQAKIEEWKDIKGTAFNAEPVEPLGPFALFRTATGGGRRVAWRALAPADCVRFASQTGDKPAPAARWTDAKGELTGRLRGYLRQFVSSNLVSANLENRPEPELLIVFSIDAVLGRSWEMLEKSVAPYNKVASAHPGAMAGIQFGMHQGGGDLYNGLAQRANLPWLLIDYAEQPRMTVLANLYPGRNNCALFALSRDGVPIIALSNPDDAAIAQFFTDVDVLLTLLRPGNPLTWADRAHYLSSLQAARHQQDRADPVLVGNPLVPQGLRDRGIFRVEAKIDVGADGKPTGVTLKDSAPVPAAMAPALAKALQRSAVFVPAVDHGQFVAGSYDYVIEVAPKQ